MAGLIDAIRNAMLDTLTIDHLSVHDGYPGGDGSANELTTQGTRATITFGAASGAQRTNTDAPEVNLSGGDVAQWYGFWEEDGGGAGVDTFLGSAPVGAEAAQPFVAEESDDNITIKISGLVDDDQVIVIPIPGQSLPTGLAENTIYHVINQAGDVIQLSATQGGGAIDITAQGGGLMQRINPKTDAQAFVVRPPVSSVVIR